MKRLASIVAFLLACAASRARRRARRLLGFAQARCIRQSAGLL